MTDKMFDEKGLRAGDAEQKAARDENADVEGHYAASEPERAAARDEDESPDVEGHRAALEPEKAAARDEGDDGEGQRAL